MKIIVAGTRTFSDYELLSKTMDGFISVFCGLQIYYGTDIEIVSGTANGADKFGERWAEEQKSSYRKNIKLKQFPADWEKHGKAAGLIRNEQMADYGQALIAFWDGKSRGTKHMIQTALKKGLMVKVVYYA